MKVWILTRHELRRIWVAPLAWTLAIAAYFFLGVLFLIDIEILLTQSPSEEISLTPTEGVVGTVFNNLAYFCIVAVPLLSMRLFSDEQRSNTISLLFSAPLTMRAIVLGKFFSMLIYLSVLLVMAAIIPLTLFVNTRLEWGVVISGAFGVLLLFSVYTAVGIYCSVLTRQPPVAGLLCLIVLLLLWLAEWFALAIPAHLRAIFYYLSFGDHFFPFLSGEIGTRHMAYFILACLFFLFLSVRHLERARLRS